MLRRWPWVLLLVAVQAAICLHYAKFALIDDAFIAMRYAVNFVNGQGLVFNPGEYVEGYTCFLWVLMLAACAALGLDPVIASKLLGALFLLLTLVVTAWFFPTDPKRQVWSVLVAPALFAANAAVSMWAVHGLETAMFTLLVTLALRADLRDHGGERFRAGWSAVGYALATLARPEGAGLFGASVLFWIVSRPGRLLEGAIWRHLLGYAAIVAPYWLWRLDYYGLPLPNTFYAKVGLSLPVVLRGMDYVLDFFAGPGALLFLALVAVLLVGRRERRLAFLGWILGAYLLMVALEGGDAFPAHRFMVPICPVLYLLVQEGFSGICEWGPSTRSGRVLARAAMVVVLAAAPLHEWRMLKSAGVEARGAIVSRRT